MAEPKNKALYERVKKKIKARLSRSGQRWSARASQQLVNEYKKAGGKYKGTKKGSKLKEWQGEKWVSINSSGNIVGACGSKKTKSGKQYRCLPEKKAKSLTKKERAATAKKKLKNPKKVISNTKKAKYVRKKK